MRNPTIDVSDVAAHSPRRCDGHHKMVDWLRQPTPERLLALAKLRRQKPKGGRMSLRAISAELAAQGFLNENGRPFSAASVKSMLT